MGCPTKNKLAFRITSGFFIRYPNKFKGYRFYFPNHSRRIVESRNARFIEDGDFTESERMRDVCIQEVMVELPIPEVLKL